MRWSPTRGAGRTGRCGTGATRRCRSSIPARRKAPGSRVAYDLYFPDFGTTSRGDLRFVAEGSGTRVTWTMDGDMGSNPLFRWFALFADGMVGQDFEAGLTHLKELAEKS